VKNYVDHWIKNSIVFRLYWLPPKYSSYTQMNKYCLHIQSGSLRHKLKSSNMQYIFIRLTEREERSIIQNLHRR